MPGRAVEVAGTGIVIRQRLMSGRVGGCFVESAPEPLQRLLVQTVAQEDHPPFVAWSRVLRRARDLYRKLGQAGQVGFDSSRLGFILFRLLGLAQLVEAAR